MKPEHFKIRYNCCNCKHSSQGMYLDGFCKKHNFILTEKKFHYGRCKDFEKDETDDKA